MKKLNNRGFLLVETIVVATFTLTVLIALFLQFKNLLVSYNNSYNYNTVEGIYNLNAVKAYVMQYQNSQNPINKQLKESSNSYLIVYNGSCSTSLDLGGYNYCENIMNAGNFKTVLYSSSNPTKLKDHVKNNSDSNISEEMKNLIKRLEHVENQNRLIAEYKDGTLATIVFGVNNEIEPAPQPEEPTSDCKLSTELKSKVVTEGDGLYQDTTEAGRYVYRGANPNNYITFNGELWRIIALESDGTLKISKYDKLTDMQQYDTPSGRFNGDGAYCRTNSSWGCNVWGSRTTMLDSSGNNVVAMPRTINGTAVSLPTRESPMAIYLNTTYYEALNQNAKAQLVNHIWNVGVLSNTDQTLETSVNQEKAYKWKGHIGLISASDYVKASTDTNCKTTQNGNTNCKNNNYMYKSSYTFWTMSPSTRNSPGGLHIVDWTDGTLSTHGAYNTYGVHPTVYLKDNLYLEGEGTTAKPYQICNEGGVS